MQAVMCETPWPSFRIFIFLFSTGIANFCRLRASLVFVGSVNAEILFTALRNVRTSQAYMTLVYIYTHT